MPRFTAVTDAELLRSRSDPGFRQKLLANNLGFLIEQLNRRRAVAAGADTAEAAQLREGAELAVKLADMISRIGPRP